jgi:hypothetical protein
MSADPSVERSAKLASERTATYYRREGDIGLPFVALFGCRGAARNRGPMRPAQAASRRRSPRRTKQSRRRYVASLRHALSATEFPSVKGRRTIDEQLFSLVIAALGAMTLIVTDESACTPDSVALVSSPGRSRAGRQSACRQPTTRIEQSALVRPAAVASTSYRVPACRWWLSDTAGAGSACSFSLLVWRGIARVSERHWAQGCGSPAMAARACATSLRSAWT